MPARMRQSTRPKQKANDRTVPKQASEAPGENDARKRAEQLLWLEHTVARSVTEADSVAAALKAVIRTVCEAQDWECGRFFRVDEEEATALPVLRFANRADHRLERRGNAVGLRNRARDRVLEPKQLLRALARVVFAGRFARLLRNGPVVGLLLGAGRLSHASGHCRPVTAGLPHDAVSPRALGAVKGFVRGADDQRRPDERIVALGCTDAHCHRESLFRSPRCAKA